MSYSIRYTFGGSAVRHGKKNRVLLVVTAICLAVFLTVGTVFRETFREYVAELFPWTKPEVKLAIDKLCEELQQGRPLLDAAEAFCREILYGAEARN